MVRAGGTGQDFEDNELKQMQSVVEIPTVTERTQVQRSVRVNWDSSGRRALALMLMCLLNFGCYFCYDNPAALEDDIMQEMDISEVQYGVFYSIYTWPNVILTFLGGYLIDRVFGIRFGAILFSFSIAAGQVVFAVGTLVNAYWLMVIGRFIFALGGENLFVARNAYAVKWFKGTQLNLVMGVQRSIARGGSTSNMYVMKPLHDAVEVILPGYRGLGVALLIAGSTAVVSWLATLALAPLDKQRDKFLQHATDVKKDDNVAKKKQHVTPRDILNYPSTYWLLCVYILTYPVAVFPFVGFGLVFYESKYQLSPYMADVCNSLVYFMSIILSPFLGALVDKFGRNIYWLTAAVVFTLIAHALFAFTFITPYLGSVLLGLGYTIQAAAIWPSVAYVVPERMLGTAYGLMVAIENIFLALFYLAGGETIQMRGYFLFEITLLASLSISLASCVALFFADFASNRILNMDGATRKAHLESTGSMDPKKK